MKLPKWTLLYNCVSEDGIISRNREFFLTKESGSKRYDEMSDTDNKGIPIFVPTLRPYNHQVDFYSLGLY